MQVKRLDLLSCCHAC